MCEYVCRHACKLISKQGENVQKGALQYAECIQTHTKTSILVKGRDAGATTLKNGLWKGNCEWG